MKCFSISDCSQIAVSFLILIHITATVCSVIRNDNTIIVHNQSLPEKDYFELNSDQITWITIFSTEITTLPEDLFKSHNNLERLDLDRNMITSLAENIFDSQTKLIFLDISANKLTSLPENVFKNLINLERLDLCDNMITSLAENIFDSQSKMRALDLSQNRLNTIPAGIFKNTTALRHLELSYNRLTTLSEDVFESQTNLTLDIQSNSLTTLHENIFRSARGIAMRQNLWHCDCTFVKLIQVNRIKIDYENVLCDNGERISDKLERSICPMAPANEINGLCPTECNCLTLNDDTEIYFDCSNNSLNSVPSGLGNELHQMPKLNGITLNFDNNGITGLPNSTFAGFELITIISAKNNSIKFLSVDHLPLSLRKIDISGNDLESLTTPVIQHLSKNMQSLNEMILNGNPWKCDCDFMKLVQNHAAIFGYDNIMCADGERMADKLKRPIISMINNKPIHPNEYNQKYVNGTVCSVLSTNEIFGICPSECNCLFPSDNSSIFIDCSNNNLKTLPAQLGNVFQHMPTLKEIELNISSNAIIDLLPIATWHGFELITKIIASNNSINFIGVDHLAPNLTEFDVSGNKLESLTVPVIGQLNSMKMLKRLVLGNNSWSCDDTFSNFTLLNKKKIDYEQIVCKDGVGLAQKHGQIFE